MRKRSSDLRNSKSWYAWLILVVGLFTAASLYHFVEGSYIWAGLLGLVSLIYGIVVILPKFLAPDRSASTLQHIEDDNLRFRVEDDRLKLQNDVRTALLQAATGVALLIGVFFTWKQLQYDRREALQVKDQSREQIELARQGQVADRFTRAVDQLGSRQVTIRLGGIYGLETIAKQSHETRLLVYEVLTAYVRQHARRGTQTDRRLDTRRLENRLPDVHAAMTVLGRRAVLPTDPPLNLREVDLHLANLKHAQLAGALFDRANLEEADFDYAQLDDVNFSGADLRDARLYNTHAMRLDAHNAIFRAAHFDRAVLAGSNFEDSILEEAYFTNAILDNANIKCADLHRSKLIDAQLQAVNLNKSELQEAQLNGADLHEAKATIETRWPSGFDWKKAGVRLVNQQKPLYCNWPRQD